MLIVITQQQNKISFSSSEPPPRILQWKDLYHASFSFQQAFSIVFVDNEQVVLDEVLRIIPQKRMTAIGTWQGKNIIAKLFFHDQHAKKHMERDQAGIEILQKNNIPTPELLYSGMSQDRRIYILLFAKIPDAENIETLWHNQFDLHPHTFLYPFIYELATQHVLGVLQKDLHLRNFLLSGKTIYTLDGSEITELPPLLNKKNSLEHLALFLAQLGVGYESVQLFLFRYYAKLRGWLLRKNDVTELFSHIKRINQERWQQYAKKIERTSTQFVAFKQGSYQGIYARKYNCAALQNILQNPESAFSHPSAHILKNGRSSTVIKITAGEKDWVIKRYNVKSFWHRVRRAFRLSRAKKSWHFFHKLNLFYVPSLLPIAVIEKKFLNLSSTSYFISEYAQGITAEQFFQTVTEEKLITEMISRISHLLHNLKSLQLTHGDLKMRNIIINAEQKPILLDLDGMKKHSSFHTLHRHHHKDIQRLLKNFRTQPHIQAKFKEYLEHRNATKK